jgi:asparagine synthase (glutamine-hydrolysing)
MPGIVGIINKIPGEINEHNLSIMINCMMHEPFYNMGTYINDELGLYAGWVCRQGSFSDCMPVFNEKKDLVLIFSGEDFADKEITRRLKTQGHEFDGTNASYLVHLYEEEEGNFLKYLNGLFQGILVDIRKGNVILFNDRYGMQRIYYHEDNDAFIFSSEAKSLLKVRSELRKIEPRGLGEFFSCGCVLQDRTLFKNVFLLPGGSSWVFHNGRAIKKDYYFKPKDWENQPILENEIFYNKLKETFSATLPKYFHSKQPIGMSLTGGLDTRMIMAWANRTPGSLPCYTFGSNYRDCADVRISRQIAKICRQPHETIFISPQFFNDFAQLAEKAVFISDGTMDVTGSVELYINKIANQVAPVRMTGNYGSEILRGNVAFRPEPLYEDLLEPEFAKLVRNACMTYGNERNVHKVSFIAFKQVPWHHYSRRAVEQSQIMTRSPYLDNDLVFLMYQAPLEFPLSKKPSFRLIADGNRDLARIPTDRELLHRPILLITKLQHLNAEFTSKAEYAYDYGMPQWLALIDHIFAPLHFEKLFLGRHKFYHFRVWYRDRLSQYLKDILLDCRARTRYYLNGRCLEEILLSHIGGKRNYTIEIHKILTAELIQRQLIEMN